MKALLTLITILILGLSASAQKKNGAVSLYHRAPFEKGESLPKNFLGHNAQALWSYHINFMGWSVRQGCSEFEKSNDCRTRLDKMAMWSLDPLGNIRATDLLAFSFGKVCTYNADKEQFSCVLDDGPRRVYSGYLWHARKVAEGTYLAQNAFGVKSRVRYLDMERWLIDTQRGKISPVEIDGINPPRAAKIADGLRVLLIGRLQSPYGETVKGPQISPTVASPYRLAVEDHVIKLAATDLWVYHLGTGEILGQWKL